MRLILAQFQWTTPISDYQLPGRAKLIEKYVAELVPDSSFELGSTHRMLREYYEALLYSLLS